ncbi:ferric iron ABC transporter iron-binding protein [Vibrio astriarenae]|nr:ferric iron ABC transporter iron-binding protein [Vibrio sp. C7]
MVNDAEQKAWADAVYINFPNQETEYSCKRFWYGHGEILS